MLTSIYEESLCGVRRYVRKIEYVNHALKHYRAKLETMYSQRDTIIDSQPQTLVSLPVGDRQHQFQN